MEQPKFIPLGNKRDGHVTDYLNELLNSNHDDYDYDYDDDLEEEKLYREQENLVKKIYDNLHINTVTCGDCGEIFFHETGKDELTCPHCGYESEICDFPDLYA